MKEGQSRCGDKQPSFSAQQLPLLLLLLRRQDWPGDGSAAGLAKRAKYLVAHPK